MARTFVKAFLFCVLLSLVFFLYKSLNEMKDNQKQLHSNKNIVQIEKNIKDINKNSIDREKVINKLVKSEEKTELKYILRWTSSKNVPFVYMGEGQSGFVERNCTYINCFVTGDRNYLGGDYTKFDVIAFAGPEIIHMYDLPKKRSPHQKFVFATIESAHNYPVCSNRLNGFFNWTWTYKVDSDARWGYMVIRDSEKKVIGPNKVMHWIKLEDMDPVNAEFKEKLKTKKKAAAWFVSNCYTKSRRELFATKLQVELKKYGLDIDVYGKCGPLDCGRDKEEECRKLLEKDYYFYLSFENSFSEDYVTEKLLTALESNVIPVVYGGANYTRFMPDGIYLNSQELDVEELAKKMNELIIDPEKYAEYFKWKKYYSYHRRGASIETDDYCRFCSMLHEEDLVKRISVYDNFREWWDPPGKC